MEGIEPDTDDEVVDDTFHYCPPGLTQDVSGCRLVWRVITVSICLPLCYPCYLTKHARQYHRRRSSTPKKSLPGSCSQSRDGTLTSNASDTSASRNTTLSSIGDRDFQIANIIVLRSETGFQLLNSLKMETICKDQGVKGKSLVTIGNFTCELVVSQEASLSKLMPEEIYNNNTSLVSDIDCVVLVYKDTDELEKTLNTVTGIIGYIKKYWSGYFPLMLIQLVNPSDQLTMKKSLLEKIEEGFSSSFRFIIDDLKSSQSRLFESLVRFYQHEVRLKCSTLEKSSSNADLSFNTSSSSSLLTNDWKCSGLCGLHTSNKRIVKKRTNFLAAAKRRLFSQSTSSQNR